MRPGQPGRPAPRAHPGIPLINVSGCAPNGDNIAATIAHWVSFGGLPAADELGRPLFAYGDRIHDHC